MLANVDVAPIVKQFAAGNNGNSGSEDLKKAAEGNEKSLIEEYPFLKDVINNWLQNDDTWNGNQKADTKNSPLITG